MMNCIGPLTPEDFELLAYADGEASPGLVAHLSACSYCRLRTEELTREERTLQSILYRAGCPRPQELGERLLNLLSAERAEAVAEHLKYCRACRAEDNTLRAFFAATEASVAVDAISQAGTRLRTIIARLSDAGANPGSGIPAPVPLPVRALRGPTSPNGSNGDPQAPLVYDADPFFVTVELWPEGPGGYTRQVVGLVAGIDDYTGAEVEVSRGEGSAKIAAVEASGDFVLSGMALGAYRMLVRVPSAGIQVQIDDFTVN